HRPEVGKRDKISISGFRCEIGGCAAVPAFDDIKVFLAAAEIGFAVGSFGSLVGFVEPPILAVDIKMVIAGAAIGLAHGAEGFATEHFAHHGLVLAIKISYARTAFARPGIILA